MTPTLSIAPQHRIKSPLADFLSALGLSFWVRTMKAAALGLSFALWILTLLASPFLLSALLIRQKVKRKFNAVYEG